MTPDPNGGPTPSPARARRYTLTVAELVFWANVIVGAVALGLALAQGPHPALALCVLLCALGAYCTRDR